MTKPEFRDIEFVLRGHRTKLHECYGIKRIGVFGSFATGKAHGKSDVDLLVSFNTPVGLFHFIETGNYLKRILGRRVDLVTSAALKPELRRRVLSQVRYI